jgi:hypothetical protein
VRSLLRRSHNLQIDDFPGRVDRRFQRQPSRRSAVLPPELLDERVVVDVPRFERPLLAKRDESTKLSTVEPRYSRALECFRSGGSIPYRLRQLISECRT